jgi:hypothetical protein
MNPIRPFLATLGAAALLAAPAVAGAARPSEHPGKGKSGAHQKSGKTRTVTYVFKGTFAGPDSVAVTKGNRHVRRAELVETTVQFDLADAKIVVEDNNGDGAKNLADVQDGDKVVVKARLAKSDPGDGPYAARKLVDQTHDQESEEGETETETETPESPE